MSFITFLKQSYRAFTGVEFYLTLRQFPMSYSIGFFVLACLVLGLTLNPLYFRGTEKELRAVFESGVSQLEQEFDPNLRLTWNTTVLEMSPAKPQTVNYPSGFSPYELGLPGTFLSLYPNEVTAEELKNKPTPSLLALTPSSWWLYLPNQAEWTSFQLQELPGFDQPFELSRQTLATFIPFWKQYFEELLGIAWVVGFAFWPIALLAIRSWMVVFNSLFLYFFLRVTGEKWSFGQIAQISMHIAIVTEVLRQVGLLLFQEEPLYLISLSFWVIWGVVIWNSRQPSLPRPAR